MRDLHILGFQLRQFLAVPYFVQTLVISTLSAVALQALAGLQGEAHAEAGELIWVRAGLMGSWTVVCLSAGLLQFMRYQSTLAPMVNSPLGPARGLAPLLLACVATGLLAFPIAALAGLLVGASPGRIAWSTLVLGVLGVLVASFAMSAVIATGFLLSEHAFTYEPLLGIPVILAAGVFGAPEPIAPWLDALSFALPFAPAAHLMLSAAAGEAAHGRDLIALAVSVAIWGCLAHVSLRNVLRRTRDAGTLEVA